VVTTSHLPGARGAVGSAGLFRMRPVSRWALRARQTGQLSLARLCLVRASTAEPRAVPVVRRQPFSSGRVVFGGCGIEGVLVGDEAEQGPGSGPGPRAAGRRRL